MPKEQQLIEVLFLRLLKAPLETFPELRKELRAPTGHGVYVIYDPREVVVHVGSTPRAQRGISQRLRNHMSGSSSFKYYYLHGDGSLLRGAYKFRCIEIENPRTRALLEAYTIGRLCPKHLGIGQARDL